MDGLLSRAEAERESISACITGAPLTEYLRNTELAETTLRNLRQSLLTLQSERALEQ